MSRTKFWKGVLLGAIAGGAISLFDRQTRKVVFENCQGASNTITYYVKHPQEAARCVKDSTGRLRSTIEEVSEEISFIAEKVDELREITPQVTDIILDSKEVLFDNRMEDKG
jgi:gas vesicle protein